VLESEAANQGWALDHPARATWVRAATTFSTAPEGRERLSFVKPAEVVISLFGQGGRGQVGVHVSCPLAYERKPNRPTCGPAAKRATRYYFSRRESIKLV
jgi:hypothetical protein